MEARHTHQHQAWNKGKLVGQKAPFKLKEIWAIRMRLQIQRRVRESALFNLGIDSKLRACDLVSLHVRDVCHDDRVAARAVVMQHKTQRPVQFEITPPTRDAVGTWIRHAGLKAEDYLFPSRVHRLPHLGTRQYARIVDGWVGEIGLDSAAYGTHSLRRTKPTLIYRRTKNLRAVQLLLGHTKLESTVRYLGIELDALGQALAARSGHSHRYRRCSVSAADLQDASGPERLHVGSDWLSLRLAKARQLLELLADMRFARPLASSGHALRAQSSEPRQRCRDKGIATFPYQSRLWFNVRRQPPRNRSRDAHALVGQQT